MVIPLRTLILIRTVVLVRTVILTWTLIEGHFRIEARPTFEDTGKNWSRDGHGHASESKEPQFVSNHYLLNLNKFKRINACVWGQK